MLIKSKAPQKEGHRTLYLIAISLCSDHQFWTY